MGKIRTKAIGLDDLEKKQKKDAQVRREQKKKRDKEPIKETKEKTKVQLPPTEQKPIEKKDKKPTKKITKKPLRGNAYQKAKKMIKPTPYKIEDAVVLLAKIKFARFDETVELHLNVSEIGLKQQITLPHGTGKEIRVVVCNDAVMEKIAKGDLDFDVLVAHPSHMPKLVKYAKLLGPKGLMPNPKKGTLTDKPEIALAKFKKGALTVKTEAKSPIIHQAVGKISFGEKKLCENIKVIIEAFPQNAITSAFVKTTMSPAIKLNLN